MCGIVGLYKDSSAELARRRVEAMADAIAHRGPDHSAVFVSESIALGYARLSILDLSPSGNQPMEDATGRFVCVYNGEAYNFGQLREEMAAQGVPFRSTSDTEVVVNLFARQGVAGVARLNGMFAFAVWSKRDRELWLFRDQLGIKPLYYSWQDGELCFASEIKAIRRAQDASYALSAEGLLNYLSFGHAVAPRTIFERIYKLLPGHYIRARDGRMETGQYFELPLPNPESKSARPDGEWIEEAQSVLTGAVRRQMVADVPVGAFLSGGLDSSLITALMTREAKTVLSFSVTFPSDSRYDEGADARFVARHLGTEHHEVQVRESDLLAAVDTLVYHFDEPYADAACLPVYLVSRFAKHHVKVALSGEGGDEMFSGYRRYYAEQVARTYLALPAALRRVAIEIARPFGRARRFNRVVRALAIENIADRYAAFLHVFNRPALERVLATDYAREMAGFDNAAVYRPLFDRCRDAQTLGRLFYVDTSTWLPDTYLEKADKASMAVSLEVRVPLLDMEVVRFAARLPENLRIRGTTTKYVLRNAARPWLPDRVLRKPKHGMAVPTDPWFRGKLNSYARDTLLSSRAASRSFLRAEAVEDLLRRHSEMRENCEGQIWTLLMLELWLRQMASEGLGASALA